MGGWESGGALSEGRPLRLGYARHALSLRELSLCLCLSLSRCVNFFFF